MTEVANASQKGERGARIEIGRAIRTCAIEMLNLPTAVVRFGGFELNAETGELWKSGAKIRLPLQPARILALLADRAGQLVTREEIRREIWGEDTYVDFEPGLNFCLNRIRAALGDRVRSPLYIETVPRRGYRFIAAVERIATAQPRIAVLPFEDLSHDPNEGFLGDAIADALITELGSVKSFRVISRQSVLHLKGTLRTAQIARELKTDVIIEGTVLQGAGRIRINAQLVQVAPEQHLWASAYECGMDDILATLGRVARAIAEAVQGELTSGELAQLSRARPAQPEGQLAYLKGRHLMGQRSRQSFERALDYFREALGKDPAHASAAAYMADCYASLGHWGYLPIEDAFRHAKESAAIAIALEPGLSTAAWVFGWATWLHDWDLDGCEAATVRAIQLNPSDEGAHVLYSIFLAAARGDNGKAVAEMNLALELDPLSQHVNTCAAWVYLFVQDYQQAITQANRTLELFPGSLQAYYVLGLAELCRSRYLEAISALERALTISSDALSVAYLGAAQACAGNVDSARSRLQELASRSEREPVPPRCFVFCMQPSENPTAHSSG